jgi:hypothetical protein
MLMDIPDWRELCAQKLPINYTPDRKRFSAPTARSHWTGGCLEPYLSSARGRIVDADYEEPRSGSRG